MRHLLKQKNAIYLIILISFILLNCDKGNSPTAPIDQNLVGTWDAVTETHYWGNISEPDSTEIVTYDQAFLTQTWTMKSNAKLTINSTFFGDDFLTLTGTWEIAGNQLIINVTFFGEKMKQTWTYEVDGDNLTLTRPADPNYEEVEWDWLVMEMQKIS